MFTGIIEEVGKVGEVTSGASATRITVSAARVIDGLEIGDSVAVNGVCLTVTAKGAGSFTADVSRETAARSSLAGLTRGSPVNLERALGPGSRLGGHIVQGHVDGTGRVKSVREAGEGRVYTFAVAEEIETYLVEKGSIAVDGISLTISAVGAGEFSVAVVPYTLEETNLKYVKAGDVVNLEVDIIAKYVWRYMERGAPRREGRDEGASSFYDKLVEGGFV